MGYAHGRATALERWWGAEAFGDDFNGSPCMHLPNKPSRNGYVVIRKDRIGPGRWNTTLAHRAIYEALIGPIQEGLTIDHLCRNRACVNPWHMETVSMRVNTLRGESLSARRARTDRMRSRTSAVGGQPLSVEDESALSDVHGEQG